MAQLQPPRLPDPPAEVTPRYVVDLLRVLRLFFTQLVAVRRVEASTLNLNIAALPTQADLPALRSGDVYRDTAAGDVLKVKP